MKKLLALLAVTFVALTGYSQTITNVPNFAQTALSWVTTLNTNSTIWTNDTVDIEVGADNQNGIPVDASLGVSASIYKALAVEDWIRNAAVAGTILSEQAGLGIQFSKYDIKFGLFLDVGYSPYRKDEFVAGAAQLSKGMTQNTFAFIRLEEDFYFKTKTVDTPLIGVGIGATF